MDTLPASLGGAKQREAISPVEQGINQARDEINGAVVHSVPPNSTPAQKASIALNAATDESSPPRPLPQLAPLPPNGATALPTDVLTNGATLKPSHALKESEAKKESTIHENDIDVKDVPVPGAMPDQPVKPRDIPDWFKIGWSGQHKEDQDPFATITEIRERAILAEFLDDAYYGSWFHNAAIIVFAVVASHFVTLFGGGWAWLVIILAISTTYYQTSMRRTRRNARDDMAREVAKTGLKTDVESATWLNLFMTRFWIIYEPVLSATIIASVDQVLSVSTPSFLNSIRMTTFTLGTKPPHIDHVRTFPDTEEDVVIMEWKISFTPNDIMDMTQRQAVRKVNPKIVLTIKLGVGPAIVGKDIIVEDIAFAGTMRIKIKLMNAFPHVQLVDLSFMAPPVFDFVLKPVGFDLSLIPGLNPFITSQLHATLGPMMYHPNIFTLNLEQMLSGAPLDTAAGVLVITLRSARGTKSVKRLGGAPDPYVSLSIGQRAELARTSTKKNTSNPNWNETKYLLLNDLNEILSLTVMDWNERLKDDTIGVANFDLKSLAEDGQQEGLSVPIMHEGKPRGELKFDAIYYPVLIPITLADGSIDPIPETSSGVVRLTVHQGKELDPRDKQIDPFAKILLNGVVVHQTQTLKRTPNPVWERPTEFLVTEKSSAMIGISVWDDNSFGGNDSLGQIKVSLKELLEAKAKQLDWFPLSGAKSGRLRISAEWKPILMVGSMNGATSYTPPIGVIRLWFKRARDLKNVEALTGGKSDPYVRILRSGIVCGRTLVTNNNLDPEFDEIVYVQVHSTSNTYTLDVMDYEEFSKDRSLGTSELTVADLIAEGTDKKNAPWLSTGKKDRKQMLSKDGKVKGSIEFEAEFIPATHLKNISFDEVTAETIIEEADESEPSTTPQQPNGKTISLPPTPATTLSRASVSGSINRPSVSDSYSARADAAKAKAEAEEGVFIPRAELLTKQSGIIAFQIISGELAKKGARLEVGFNGDYWPAYSTEHSRSTHCKWDEIGEFLIRELDYSTITLKLNTADRDAREDVIASYTADLNDFLEASLDKPATFTLTDPSGGARSTVKICSKYIPVPMTILPRESVNNSGVVRVDLLDAKDLPSADRSGKSDPFAVFELNGDKVFKSEVIKKTLHPTWNENFETQVPSRTAAKLFVNIYDWDRVGVDRLLGRGGPIDLAALEPFDQNDLSIHLTDAKTGKSHSIVRVKLVFRPGFISRSRGSTSTFSSLGGRAITNVGGGALAVGGGVAGAGVSGVGAIGKGVARGFGSIGSLGKKRSSLSPNDAPYTVPTSTLPPVPAVPADFSDSAVPPQLPTNRTTAPTMSGTLSVTIVQLSGTTEAEDDKKVVSLRAYGKSVGDTHSQRGETAQFNQSFSVKTGTAPLELDFSVLHKKTFGTDKVLGTAIVQAWDHIKPAVGTNHATIDAPLSGGTGNLQITLDWTSSPPPTIEEDRVSVASTRKSRVAANRFSFVRRDRESSATPSE